MSEEAARAGENAAAYVLHGEQPENAAVCLVGKNGVRYTVPQLLDVRYMPEQLTVRFRVGQPYRDVTLCVWFNETCFRHSQACHGPHGEMEQFVLRRTDLPTDLHTITFTVEEDAK